MGGVATCLETCLSGKTETCSETCLLGKARNCKRFEALGLREPAMAPSLVAGTKM